MEHPVRYDVALHPSDSLVWQHYEDKAGHQVYINPRHEPNDDPVQIIRSHDRFGWRHKELGSGMEGNVKQIGGYAVKKFYDKEEYQSGSIGDLAINVGIAEGLRELKPVNFNYTFRGVDILAAVYKPQSNRQFDASYWIMERLHDAVPNWVERFRMPLPEAPMRCHVRREALGKVGIASKYLFDDDRGDRSSNFMVTRIATPDTPGEITLLDARFADQPGCATI